MAEASGDDPVMTAVAAWAGADPAAPVLVTERGTLTCSDLVRSAEALRRCLTARAIGGGRVVLLAAPSSAQWLVGFLAAYASGAVVAPVAVDAGLDERTLVLDRLRPAAVLHWEASAWTRAQPCPALEIDLDSGGQPEVHLDRSPPLDRPLDGEAVVFYTSGTTGASRGVVHSTRSLVTSALGRPPGRSLPHAARGAGLRVFTSYPFASIAGFILVLRALLQRHTVVSLTRFHPRRALELIEGWRVEGILGGPAHVRLMIRLRDFGRRNLRSVRFVNLGGDHVPRDLADAVEEAFDCTVSITYGSTELGGAAAMSLLSDPADTRIGAVGRPVPGVEMRVLDDAGVDVGPWVQGELFVRSPSSAIGFHGEHGIEPLGDPDGWVATGDLAVEDEFGVVRILGRKGGVIVRGGRKFLPEEIEAVLMTDPAVSVARVRMTTAADGTQRVTAAVVPIGAPEAALPAALLRRCRERLAAHKVPDRIDVVPHLDVTSTGKVRRSDG